MLGVGFDALKQRELARRNRRLVLVATASVSGMVLATGLAVLALLARQEAVEQRTRAEAETETSRQVTNFLVDLFKVSDPSEALGNTITAGRFSIEAHAASNTNLSRSPSSRRRSWTRWGRVQEPRPLQFPEGAA